MSDKTPALPSPPLLTRSIVEALADSVKFSILAQEALKVALSEAMATTKPPPVLELRKGGRDDV